MACKGFQCELFHIFQLEAKKKKMRSFTRSLNANVSKKNPYKSSLLLFSHFLKYKIRPHLKKNLKMKRR